MSKKSRLKDKLPTKNAFFSGIFSLLIKQVLAALLCLALVLGMKHSGNEKLNNYAKSLGLAIKFNPRWEETVKEAFLSFKNQDQEPIEENFK